MFTQLLTRPRAGIPVTAVIALALLLALPASAAAAVPGQNGRIAFQSTSGGPAHLAVVNPDGSGIRSLPFPDGQAGQPAWSPDGTKIAFVGWTPEGIHIGVMDFFTGAALPLTSGAGSAETHPAWSPDGMKIAFTRCSGDPEDCDVWVVNADGTNPVNLTQNPSSGDSMPAWSPDGAKIAFSTARDGNSEIYVMNSDGSGPVRLTDAPEQDLSPDWSPDGAKILFARHDAQEVSTVWVMDAAGTNPASLGSGDQPVFSPDGAKIAFVLQTDLNRDLWMMNADGASGMALVATPAGESAPSWQPVVPGENLPPVADAGPDATFTCESPETAPRLDGGASTDPDSTPDTNDDIRLFEWWLDFGLPTEAFLGTGEVVDQLSVASGTYTVTLQVTDSKGQTATDEVVLIIDDQTPPQITVKLSPGLIWPPNHRMVAVRADVEALDYCGPAVVILKSVTSNEPDDSTGDGHTAPDIQKADVGTADFLFKVRAERSGNGTGRIYTATYEATDLSGNSASASGETLVPHDKGRRKGNGGNPDPGVPPGQWKDKGKGNDKGNGNGHGKH